MARKTIGQLIIDMTTRTTKLHQGLEDSRRGIRGWAGKIGGIVGKVGLAVGGVGAGLWKSTKAALDFADAIGKGAGKAGVSVDFFQKWRFAAEQAGVSQDKFTNGLGTFGKRLGELKNDTGALAGFLKKYDEKLAEELATAGDVETSFRIFMDHAATIKDSAERSAFLSAGFSKSIGLSMNNLVKGGVDNMNETLKKFDDLGVSLTNEQVKAAEAANDAMHTMATALKGAWFKALAELSPLIVELSQRITDFLIAAIEVFVGWIKIGAEWVVTFSAKLGEVIEWIGKFAKVLIEDIVAAFETVKQTFTDVMGKLDEWGAKISDTMKAAKESVGDMVTSTKDWFGNKLTAATDIASDAAASVSEAFREMEDAVTGNSYVPDMVNAIKDWFGRLGEYMVKPAQDKANEVSTVFRDMAADVGQAWSAVLTDFATGKIGSKDAGDAFVDVLKQKASNWVDGFIGGLIDKAFDKGTNALANWVDSRAGGTNATGSAATAAGGGGGSGVGSGAAVINNGTGAAAAGYNAYNQYRAGNNTGAAVSGGVAIYKGYKTFQAYQAWQAKMAAAQAAQATATTGAAATTTTTGAVTTTGTTTAAGSGAMSAGMAAGLAAVGGLVIMAAHGSKQRRDLRRWRARLATYTEDVKTGLIDVSDSHTNTFKVMGEVGERTYIKLAGEFNSMRGHMARQGIFVDKITDDANGSIAVIHNMTEQGKIAFQNLQNEVVGSWNVIAQSTHQFTTEAGDNMQKLTIGVNENVDIWESRFEDYVNNSQDRALQSWKKLVDEHGRVTFELIGNQEDWKDTIIDINNGIDATTGAVTDMANAAAAGYDKIARAAAGIKAVRPPSVIGSSRDDDPVPSRKPPSDPSDDRNSGAEKLVVQGDRAAVQSERRHREMQRTIQKNTAQLELANMTARLETARRI